MLIQYNTICNIRQGFGYKLSLYKSVSLQIDNMKTTSRIARSHFPFGKYGTNVGRIWSSIFGKTNVFYKKTTIFL